MTARLLVFILIFNSIYSYGFSSSRHIKKKKCGKINVSYQDQKSTQCGWRLELDESSDLSLDNTYKTPGRVVSLYFDTSFQEQFEKTQEAIDFVFLDIVKSKALKRFEEAMSLANSSSEPELATLISEAKKEVFKENKRNPKMEIRKYLSLFPGIEDDLLLDDPGYKSLICHYEVWNHRQKMLKKFGKILGLIGTIGGIAGIGAAAILSIPLIPVALYSLAALKTASGGIKITHSILNRDDLAAGKSAKMILKVYDKMNDDLKDLKDQKKEYSKDDIPDQNQQAEIKQVSDDIIKLNKVIEDAEDDIEELEDAVKNRRQNIKNLVSGIASTTFGVMAFLGGLYASERLNDFEAKPGDVEIIQNTTINNPDDLSGGGGIIDSDPP